MYGTTHRPHDRFRGVAGLLAITSVASSCVHPRPLTRREATIPVVENAPSTIAALQRDCRPVGEVVPFSDPATAKDDARRHAGENQAQVALKVMELDSAGIFNCQFWRCPASRGEKSGYLAWRRGTGTFDRGLKLVQDGREVNDGTFRGLSDLVAREPAALAYAHSAEASMQRAHTRSYVALGLLSVALAGAGAMLYGTVKGNTKLLLGGLGATVALTSAGWGLAASGANAANAATSDAMNAVDLYNGDQAAFQSSPPSRQASSYSPTQSQTGSRPIIGRQECAGGQTVLSVAQGMSQRPRLPSERDINTQRVPGNAQSSSLAHSWRSELVSLPSGWQERIPSHSRQTSPAAQSVSLAHWSSAWG